MIKSLELVPPSFLPSSLILVPTEIIRWGETRALSCHCSLHNCWLSFSLQTASHFPHSLVDVVPFPAITVGWGEGKWDGGRWIFE